MASAFFSVSQVFAIVVFASITTEGYINSAHSAEAKCIFNQSDSACQYAVGIGVIGFLACVGFLVLDVYLPFMSNAQERKYAVMADLGFSGKRHFICTLMQLCSLFVISGSSCCHCLWVDAKKHCQFTNHT